MSRLKQSPFGEPWEEASDVSGFASDNLLSRRPWRRIARGQVLETEKKGKMKMWTVYTDVGDWAGIIAGSAKEAERKVWYLTLGRAKMIRAVRVA